MNRTELTEWALANGWQMVGEYPCLMKPSSPKDAIVRLVLKATVASIEIRKPAGKWEKISGQSYSKITPDADGVPQGLGLDTIAGLSMLMQDNKDRMVFAKLSGAAKSDAAD
jgi:hypothetical protein